jgi:hypothetical protein
VGLYFDAAGMRDQAAEHIAAAVDHRIGHYMWDVANVHAKQFQGKTAEAKKQ